MNAVRESDERVARLAREYRDGSLLSGELKDLTAEKITGFLDGHQERRDALGSLESEVAPYRLTRTERKTARSRIGYPEDALIQS